MAGERIEIAVNDAAVCGGQALGLRCVRTIDRRDHRPGDAQRRARMGVADVAGAQDADVDGHRHSSPMRERMEAKILVPSHRFCRRRFSFAACWLSS